MIRFRRGSVGCASCALSMMLLVALPFAVAAAPQPGDVFREYRWTNEGGDAGGSLRVGGRLDYGGGPIELSHDFDLTHATEANWPGIMVLIQYGKPSGKRAPGS